MNIVILGVSGMLGSTLFKYFSLKDEYRVCGTARSLSAVRSLPPELINKVKFLDCQNPKNYKDWLSMVQADVVINCIGIIKQLKESKNPLDSIKINALFPHELAGICNGIGAKLIHFGTDCVFTGSKGGYDEESLPDATDLYGLTKLLGEVKGENCLTLRTSIIGHELNTHHSLMDWFLSQPSEVLGYTHAIFSGLPTLEVARVLDQFVLPRKNMQGLYHLSGDPIDKYSLLTKIKRIYKKDIVIKPYDDFVIDRSLNSSRFRLETGYKPLSWDQMIEDMYAFRIKNETN
jgi:dTDP-4-dehydrorhamnose reductase